MKNFRLFCLKFLIINLFIATECPFTFAKEDNWQLAHDKNNMWVWMLKNQKDVIGTLHITQRPQPIDLKGFQGKSFLKTFKNERQKILKIMGISQWTVNEHQFKRASNYYKLTLEGTYWNAQNQLISFYEIYLFYPQKTYQILFSHPFQNRIRRNVASQFIAKAKKVINQ